MTKSTSTFEAAYDRYSPILYGIALEIAPTEKDAEGLLISTFKKISRQTISKQNGSSLIITLVKLIIQTARETFHPGAKGNVFILKLFESTPMLHRSFCELKGFECYCSENGLNREDGFRQMRKEFYFLRTRRLVNLAQNEDEQLPDQALVKAAP